jgi:hypothetical protein
MADTKHSAGPWRVDGPDCYGDYNILPAGEELAIGAVVRNGFRSDEETAANAHLVGAAVDLDAAAAEAWKALAWIINYDSEDKALAHAMARIEAAREKAGTFDYEAMRREVAAKAEGENNG